MQLIKLGYVSNFYAAPSAVKVGSESRQWKSAVKPGKMCTPPRPNSRVTPSSCKALVRGANPRRQVDRRPSHLPLPTDRDYADWGWL